MNIVTLTSFDNELGLIKIGSVMYEKKASMLAAGLGAKYILNAAVHEYGHHAPILRRMAAEISGVGARTALQGKPLLSAPFRHAARLSGEGGLMGIYTKSHQAALAAKKHGISLPEARDVVLKSGLAEHFPDAKTLLDTSKNIPLKRGAGLAGRMRRIADYAFTPVGQVGKDISRFAKKSYERAGLSKPELSELYAKKLALNKLK